MLFPFYSSQEMGQRITLTRESLDMTHEQLAQLMKTSTETIIQIEQGQQLLPTGWLYKLTQFFGIDAIWLLTGARPPIAKEKVPAYEELGMLLQVPEVAEMIYSQLKTAKLIFKDQIKKGIVPKKSETNSKSVKEILKY